MDIRLVIKSILLFLFIALSNPLLPSRLDSLGFSFGLLIYSAYWFISISVLMTIAFQAYSHTKLIISLALTLSSTLSINYYIVTSQYMEFYEFEAMLHAANNASDALMAFDGLWVGFLSAGIGLLALLMPLRNPLTVNRLRILLPVFTIVIMLIGILYAREGEGTKGMPSQFTPMAYSAVMLKDFIVNPSVKQVTQVTSKQINSAFTGDIVVVMDESVRGDFLDINRLGGVRTPFISTQPDLVNFGIASSSTNCSDTSNLSLRRGVSKAHYLRDKDQNPSLWQYAKKAGYRTVYLDAQLTNGRLGNHMTEEERTNIDIFYQVSDEQQAVMDKDIKLAKQLNRLLNDETSDFIYINKMGAHFPYEGKYPESAMSYQPVMESNQFNKSYPEPGELAHPDDYSKRTRLKFLNSYKNALSWNITSFFNALTAQEKERPYVMFYTSDHGQSFHDDGRPGYGTHCSISNTDPEEGIVPFLVMSNHAKQLAAFKRASVINYNKVSHFNIAPTVYELMGYDAKTSDSSERTVFQPLNKSDQRFLSKYFVRFGSAPIWNSIDMKGRDSLNVWASRH